MRMRVNKQILLKTCSFNQESAQILARRARLNLRENVIFPPYDGFITTSFIYKK